MTESIAVVDIAEGICILYSARIVREGRRNHLAQHVGLVTKGVLESAKGAHRREERVGFFVHQVGTFMQMVEKIVVELKLVSTAIDHRGRVLLAEGDDLPPFFYRSIVRRLHVHQNSQLVRRRHILLHGDISVKSDIIEAELLEFSDYVKVKRLVVRGLYRFGVVAMLTDAAQIIGLAVKTEMHSVNGQPPYAEDSFERRVTAGEPQGIKPRALGAPAVERLGIEGEIPLREAAHQLRIAVEHRPFEIHRVHRLDPDARSTAILGNKDAGIAQGRRIYAELDGVGNAAAPFAGGSGGNAGNRL